MPNYCNSVVTLSGEGLGAFRKSLNGEKFSFQQLVPRSEEDEKNWYWWSVENWGSKWDVIEYILQDNGDSIVIDMETAWSPPLPWARRVSQLIPDLKIVIEYREPGVRFSGTYTALNGEDLNTPEEFVDSVED